MKVIKWLIRQFDLAKIDNLLVKVQFISGKLNHKLLTEEIRFKTKWFWFSLFIQIFNVFRNILYLFLPNDETVLKYFGDFNLHIVSKRRFLLIPCLSFSLVSSFMLLLTHYSSLSSLEWFKVIALIQGYDWRYPSNKIVVPLNTRLHRKLKRGTFFSIYFIFLNITLFTTFFASILSFSISLIHYNTFDFMVFGIFWSINQTIWSFYCAGVGGAAFSLYLIVSYYLKLRVQTIHENLDKLIKFRLISNTSINKITSEFQSICLTTHIFNKFWSKYNFIVLSIYILTNALLLFNLVFDTMNLMTRSAVSLVFCEISLIIILVSYSGATLSSHFNQCHKKFCSLYILSKNKSFRISCKVSLIMFSS